MRETRGSSSVVEHLLAKEGVASSNLVFRSIDAIGARLRFRFGLFESLEEDEPCVLRLAARMPDPLIIYFRLAITTHRS